MLINKVNFLFLLFNLIHIKLNEHLSRVVGDTNISNFAKLYNNRNYVNVYYNR